MTFSSSCPASAAIVMVTSLPMMSKATCETTSGMTGLTLPGMIEEPGRKVEIYIYRESWQLENGEIDGCATFQHKRFMLE